MTYNDAVIERDKIATDKSRHEGYTFNIIIVAPTNQKEMNKFIDTYVRGNVKISPIPFSSDNNFDVYGIMLPSSTNILVKKLT